MPEDKSRSLSPAHIQSPKQEERRRSRSPRRDTNRRRRNEGGFKWKEKRRSDEDEQTRDGNGRLERGYKEHYRARSAQRGGEADDREQKSKSDSELPKREKEKKEKKERKQKKATAVPASDEAMIIVNINDRLGTKAAIPCFASDPISNHWRLHCVTTIPANICAELFKAQVAARIGREPHEILLKRQGERPFKDQLTLEDYGVSNGVQLDL